jgi:serine/threonine-protein kinase
MQPDSIGPYKITGIIGQGGMAIVYKAYDSAADRTIALKLLPHQLTADPNFLERFKREGRLIARLEHLHILPVYSVGTTDNDVPYIAMRYLDGGSLAERQEAGPIVTADLTRIITQVSQALDFAHDHGLVHRDIKPSNILLDKFGNAFLADFGIAKMIEGSIQFTGSNVIGTPAYMSPEQGRGQQLDRRADVYSLACLAYELIVGAPPYIAENPMGLLMRHIADPVPHARNVNNTVSPQLDELLYRAMSKNREDRPATAGEFARQFERATSSRPVTGPTVLESNQQPETTILERPVTSPSIRTVLDAAPASEPRRPIARVSSSPAQPASSSNTFPSIILGFGCVTGLGLLILAFVTVLALGNLPFGFGLSPTSIPSPTQTSIVAQQPTDTHQPLPTHTATQVPPTETIPWVAYGGSWTGPFDGLVQGESIDGDGLYLYQKTYTDFVFTAEVLTPDREASLAFRMQDRNNGYLLILVPTGIEFDANPGLYLAKRIEGDHFFFAYSDANLPAVGEWAELSVEVTGRTIRAYLNGALAFEYTDTAAPPFDSGMLGFRIFGDEAGRNYGGFRSIELP